MMSSRVFFTLPSVYSFLVEKEGDNETFTKIFIEAMHTHNDPLYTKVECNRMKLNLNNTLIIVLDNISHLYHATKVKRQVFSHLAFYFFYHLAQIIYASIRFLFPQQHQRLLVNIPSYEH